MSNYKFSGPEKERGQDGADGEGDPRCWSEIGKGHEGDRQKHMPRALGVTAVSPRRKTDQSEHQSKPEIVWVEVHGA